MNGRQMPKDDGAPQAPLDDERGGRIAALDRFAGVARRDDGPSGHAVIPTAMYSGADVAVGAQPIAVRRDEAKVLAQVRALAAAAGAEWYYRYPVKNNKTGKQDWIEGPSIKLANDLARLYGNNSVDCAVVDLGDRWLIHARFRDFETGYQLSRPFLGNKGTGRIGGSDDSRRQDMAFQIAVSKAQRNVIVNALQTHASFAFDEAKNSLIEKIGEKLDAYRQRVLAKLEEDGIDVKRAERIRGRVASSWLAHDVAALIAQIKAVGDGMATYDESFPPLNVATDTGEVIDEATVVETGMDQLAADGKPAEAKPSTDAKPAATETVKTDNAAAQGDNQKPAAEKTKPKAKAETKPVEEKPVEEKPVEERPKAKVETKVEAPVEERAQSGHADPVNGNGTRKALAPEQIELLRKYHSALGSQMSNSGLQKRGSAAFNGEIPDEGTPLGDAVQRIYQAHAARVAGKSSPVETDNVVAEVIRAAS